jgi:hypothetical protein
MGNSNSIPESHPNKQELDVIRNVLAQDTESFSGDKTNKVETAPLEQKGGLNSCTFKVDDIVKRKSRTNEHEPCDLVGKVTEIIQTHEWPSGSGKKIPTMYVINFPGLFVGTSHANVKLAFPCCDLELVYDSKH